MLTELVRLLLIISASACPIVMIGTIYVLTTLSHLLNVHVHIHVSICIIFVLLDLIKAITPAFFEFGIPAWQFMGIKVLKPIPFLIWQNVRNDDIDEKVDPWTDK